MSVQCFDKDFFTKDNAIGECQIDLEAIILDTALVKKPLTLNKKYFDECMKAEGRREDVVDLKFDKTDDKTFWL